MGLLILLGIAIFFVIVFKHLKKAGSVKQWPKPAPQYQPGTKVAAPVIERPKEPVRHCTKYFCYSDNGYGYISYWPLNQMIGDYLQFNITGINFRRGLRDYIGEFKGTLEADPKNRYDKNAIKVLAADGKHLGFVPRDMTDNVREFCELPCDCYGIIRHTVDDKSYYFGQAYITKTPPSEQFYNEKE